MEQIFKIQISDELQVKMTPGILNACIKGFKDWAVSSIDITDKYKELVNSHAALMAENEIPPLPEMPVTKAETQQEDPGPKKEVKKDKPIS